MDGMQKSCTTFLRVEVPTLISHYFEYITFVDAHDFRNQKKVSLTNKAELVARGLQDDRVLTSLVARGDDMTGYCMNWEGYGDDPNGLCQPKVAGPSYSAGKRVERAIVREILGALRCTPEATTSAICCGIHIVQYKATNEGLGNIQPDWPFNFTLKDSNTEVIGGNDVDVLGGSTYSLPSALPYTSDITPGVKGYGDNDPIGLAYAGWKATTLDPPCGVGKYNGDYRQIDCGFPCS